MHTNRKTILLLLILLNLFSGCTGIQKNLKVSTAQLQIPLLKGNAENQALCIKIESLKDKPVPAIKFIKINFDGTDDLNDIAEVKIFCTGNDSILNLSKHYPLFGNPEKPAKQLTFNGTTKIPATTSFFIVSLKMAENADLHHKVDVQCAVIQYNDNTKSIPTNKTPDLKQRIGIALRQHLEDGVDTYRIPGLTTTNQGTLLAIYDARRNSSRDLQGDIDIGVSRSTDGGNTWEPMRIGLDMGEWGNLPEKLNGVSDPCILVDKNSDKIFLAGLWMHGVLDKNGKWINNLDENSNAWNHQWRNKGSQPGFGVKQTSQFMVATSTDDGKTWSQPVNLTRMCKKEAWWLWAPAPGHGITLDDGTLVFPTQGRDENGKTFSNITYSKDDGKSWHTSQPAYSNTTENMVVQLDDGSLMLNARYNANRNNHSDTNGRVVVTTNDLGQTWTEHPTSRSALIESTCMASIHKHVYHENGEEKSILLFTNPNTKTGRHHMTLKVSFDNGNTWPEKYWILLDEGKSRGYSCITSIDENTVGILYEGSQADMTFESIPLSEIINP